MQFRCEHDRRQRVKHIKSNFICLDATVQFLQKGREPAFMLTPPTQELDYLLIFSQTQLPPLPACLLIRFQAEQ